MATLLLIEDNFAISSIIAESLQTIGHKVLYADEPTLALLVAKNFQEIIDLVIFDINLPKHTGIEICELIKESNPNVKFICVSGYVQSHLKEIQKLGATIVEKPFKIEDFVQVVKDSVI